jgi:hypothetical protein
VASRTYGENISPQAAQIGVARATVPLACRVRYPPGQDFSADSFRYSSTVSMIP